MTTPSSSKRTCAPGPTSAQLLRRAKATDSLLRQIAKALVVVGIGALITHGGFGFDVNAAEPAQACLATQAV